MIWTFLLTLFSVAGSGEEYTIVSHYVADGKRNKTAYSDCIVFSNYQSGSDNEVTVQSQWTPDSLYFYFTVKDHSLRACQTETDHEKLFLDDMVEVLIDPRFDKGECWAEDDIVYHVNLFGVKKDDRGSADCVSDPRWDGRAVFRIELRGTVNDEKDTDEGYGIEMAIPWTEVGVIPSVGSKLAVNFANGDNDGKGRQLFDWVGAWPLRSPHAFGNLVLFKSDKR